MARAGDGQGSPWAGGSSLLRDTLCLHKPERGKVRLILNLNKQGKKAMPELALPSGDAWPGTRRAQPWGSHHPWRPRTDPNPTPGGLPFLQGAPG